MQGLLSPLRCLLVLLLVTAAIPPALAQDPAGSDPISRFFVSITDGLSHPMTSVCSSPVFSLYERVANPGGESKDLDHCIQFVAVQAGDTSQCRGIRRGAPMTKCYVLIASKKNDPAVCDEVPPTDDMQAYLRVDCLWEVAIKNNNPEACRQMGTSKISRMFIGEMSQKTCQARLASGQGVGESTL
jgi:hypothetical protein